jgi:hypothetical protein
VKKVLVLFVCAHTNKLWPMPHCVHRTATNCCRNVAPTSGTVGTEDEIGAVLSWDESGPDLITLLSLAANI